MILKLSPYRRSQRILTARTLAEAVKGCDSYAKKAVKGSLSLGCATSSVLVSSCGLIITFLVYRLLRSAKWRREEATVNQKNWLRTRLGKGGKLSASGGEFNAKDTFTMTKGQAADLITRMKHGALVGGIMCEILFQGIDT